MTDPDNPPHVPISRLAPTPSGYLHLGNAFNFIYTWLLIRSQRGILHLRIDDLDQPRVRPEYVHDLFDTLEWLGLTYDKGPKNARELTEKYSQQHRMSAYQEARQVLEQRPETYYCQCSRRDASGQPDPCKNLNLTFERDKTALKVNTQKSQVLHLPTITGETRSGEPNQLLPDFVVWRKDGLPAYQLASVVDDVQMNITTVVRGEDLWPSSVGQFYLAELLGYRTFQTIRFVHHPLITDRRGTKLSKSAKSPALKTEFRSARHVMRAAGEWLQLGQNHDRLDTLLDAYRSQKRT